MKIHRIGYAGGKGDEMKLEEQQKTVLFAWIKGQWKDSVSALFEPVSQKRFRKSILLDT